MATAFPVNRFVGDRDRLLLFSQNDLSRLRTSRCEAVLRVGQFGADRHHPRLLVGGGADPNELSAHLVPASIGPEANRLAQGEFACVFHGDVQRQPHSAGVRQLEQHPRGVHHFPGHDLPSHDDAVHRGLHGKEIGCGLVRVEMLGDGLGKAKQSETFSQLLFGQRPQLLDVHRKTEISERLLGAEQSGAGLDKPRLGLLDLAARHDLGERFQPLEGLALKFFLRQGLDQFRLGPSDLGRIDQGQDFARANPVADVLLDVPHRPRQTRREAGKAGLVVGDLAIGRDRLADRLALDESHVHARLLHRFQGRELDSSAVVLADGVVLRPRGRGQGSCRPLPICLGDNRRLFQLRDLGMAQRAVRNAVLLAPAVILASGQKVRMALDALRLRHAMLLAPIVPRGDAIASECRELRQLPTRVMSIRP